MTTAPPPMTPVRTDDIRLAPVTAASCAAVVAVWAGVVGGIVLKAAFGGWMLLVIMIGSPILVGIPVLGAACVTHALVACSSTRRRYAVVPRRYVAAAWAIGAGMFVAGAVLPDGGDDEPARSAVSAALGLDTASDSWFPVSQVAWLVAAVAAALAVWWVAADRRARRRWAVTEPGL